MQKTNRNGYNNKTTEKREQELTHNINPNIKYTSFHYRHKIKRKKYGTIEFIYYTKSLLNIPPIGRTSFLYFLSPPAE